MKSVKMVISQSAAQRERGKTLPEMLVAVSVGTLVLGMIGVISVQSMFSFAAMGNYVSMDQASRQALDQMTRDIRKSQDLLSFSTNQLVFIYAGTTNLTYRWDRASRQLVQWKTGDARTNVLLTDCDFLLFAMFKNVPSPGGSFTNTTVVSQGKSISVSWKCSRTKIGRAHV